MVVAFAIVYHGCAPFECYYILQLTLVQFFYIASGEKALFNDNCQRLDSELVNAYQKGGYVPDIPWKQPIVPGVHLTS